MKVLIRTRDGIKQPYQINPKNLEKLQAKYGDRLEIVESKLTKPLEYLQQKPRIYVKVKTFFCERCRKHKPIIEHFDKNVCLDCKK